MNPLRILVLSDSHGNCSDVSEIIQKESPFDFILFCGDGLRDLDRVSLPSKCRVIRVSGNMDASMGPVETKVAFEHIGGKKIMITHGDMFQVQLGLDLLRSVGNRESADIIVFGHTHRPFLKHGTPILFNPGPADRGCYGIITLAESIRLEHRRLPE